MTRVVMALHSAVSLTLLKTSVEQVPVKSASIGAVAIRQRLDASLHRLLVAVERSLTLQFG